jgi:hypothetical protein
MLATRTASMLESMGISISSKPKQTSRFRRDLLPTPAAFWKAHGVTVPDGKGWKMTRCSFHEDTHASLAVNTESGGFFCHACGVKGGDVLAAYQLLNDCDFVTAAKALGAWDEKNECNE